VGSNAAFPIQIRRAWEVRERIGSLLGNLKSMCWEAVGGGRCVLSTHLVFLGGGLDSKLSRLNDRREHNQGSRGAALGVRRGLCKILGKSRRRWCPMRRRRRPQDHGPRNLLLVWGGKGWDAAILFRKGKKDRGGNRESWGFERFLTFGYG